MQSNLQNASKEELLSYISCLQNQNTQHEIKIEEHQVKINQQHSRISQQHSRISQQSSKITQQHSRIEELKHQLSWLRKQQFGAKTERLIPQDPNQCSLFEVTETPPEKTTTVKQYERKARKSPSDTTKESKLRFDESIPVKEIILLPEEVKGLNESEYEVIGKKESILLFQIPIQYRIEKTIRPTVKIKSTGKIYTHLAPSKVIDKSFASSSFLTSLIVEKFLYHQPLYRQHQRLLRAGINISRNHLTNLTLRALELLEPVYLAILSSAITSDVICMDETPIKAGRRVKGKMKTAYFWPVLGNEELVFIYSNTRSKETIFKALDKPPKEQRCTKLLSDGYAAYNAYAESREDLTHAYCWAHARRKFFDARDYAPKQCDYILNLIKKLFEVEKLGDVAIQRRLRSSKLVDDYFNYLNKLIYEDLIDRTSPLGKAVIYSIKLEKGLREFINNPDIPLSNNHVERAIRPIAVGRKNWMFCWSETGARAAAMAFTLIENCKFHDINPWDYINDVLVRIDTHPAKDIDLLTPKNWKQNFSQK